MTDQTTANILTTAADLFGITAIDINNLTSRSTWSTAEAIEALPENVHRLTQQGSLQAGSHQLNSTLAQSALSVNITDIGQTDVEVAS